MAGLVLDQTQRGVLDDLFDKWSLLVLDRLCTGRMRFSELRRSLPSVAPKSLTETLRRLERNGMIHRHVVASSPVQVSYSISPLGRSLEAPLHGILGWIADHTGEVVATRDAHDSADDAAD